MYGSQGTFQAHNCCVWYNAMKGQTLGHYYAGNDQIEELAAWIQHGGNCSYQTNSLDKFPGTTPAHMILYNSKINCYDQYRLLQMMLAQNPELVHIQKNDGETLGHIAAKQRKIYILSLLAQYGDHFEKRDNQGNSVMDYTSSIFNYETRQRACSIVYPLMRQHWSEYYVQCRYNVDTTTQGNDTFVQ